MTDTANLALPFIDGSQAQKHVTHNEALRILDAAIQIGVLDMNLTVPTSTPVNGERHVVGAGATGLWAGQANAIATWEDGAWRFLVPKPGWLVWSAADNSVFAFNGTVWSVISAGSGGGGGGSPTFDDVPHIGINSAATSPNLLSVYSNAALFDAITAADGGTGDARVQISKESSANTASVVFSDSFSGRAEFGLVGTDDFKLKVSADGVTFTEAFTIDRVSGNLNLPRGVVLSGVISPAQITANQNDYNPTGIAAASVLQISSDASRTISGLAGGADGRILYVVNVGSQSITLLDESTASLAANRFTLGVNLVLVPKQAAILRYDGTAARWFAIARSSSGGGLSISTSADLAGAISDETGSGSLVFASSPTFSGTPLAPTAAVDTNTTQLATTAFVLGQASASSDGAPATSGIASRGTSTHYARADHVHPTDTSRAPASNIALSALAAQATNTFVGNVSGSPASPVALTATQVTAALSSMIGDTGSGGTKGLVPAPGAGDGAAGKFLKADGTYAVPPGTGGGGGGISDVDRQNIVLERIYQSKLYGGYRRGINAFADGYKSSTGINSGASSNYAVNTTSGYVSPSMAGTTVTLNTNSTIASSGNTLVDRSGALVNGAVVSSIGVYCTVAISMNVKIVKQNSTTNFDVVVDQAVSHPGTGWVDFTLSIPYTVPASGTYNIATYNAVSNVNVTASVARSAVGGNQGVSTGVAFIVDTNPLPPTRYTYNTSLQNMAVVTAAQTADASVSNARVLIEYDATANPTLNTDLTVEVTCDGGAHWTAAALSLVTSNGQSGRTVVETVDQACTAGTSFAARIKTLNNKNVPIYGTSLTVH